MAIGKFNRPAAAAAKPAVVKKSRYAGIKASQPRPPMPHEGTYRFRVLSTEEGYNPGTDRYSFKIGVEFVAIDGTNEHHSEGDASSIVFLVSGPAANSGLGRVKSFVIAAGGFESEEAYDEFDPDGGFIESITGTANSFTQTLNGRLVDCLVTRGNAIEGTNDYYREFAWAVVDESEQDQTPAVVAQ